MLKPAFHSHPPSPEGAETPSLPNKAAGKSKPEAYPLGYVEDFDEPRTKLEVGFSISIQCPNFLRNAAPTNPLNKGCGRCGRELYSGWN